MVVLVSHHSFCGCSIFMLLSGASSFHFTEEKLLKPATYQESERGMLVQLVWKPTSTSRSSADKVWSNWKRKSSSRLRRDMQRHERYLSSSKSSQLEVPVTNLAAEKQPVATESEHVAEKQPLMKRSQHTAEKHPGVSIVEDAAEKQPAVTYKSTFVPSVVPTDSVLLPATEACKPKEIPSDHGHSKDHTSSASSAPVASRIRSRGAADVELLDHSANEHRPDLQLSGLITDVTSHHKDHFRCEDARTAEVVKDAMKSQWSAIVYTGRKVKVRLKDELVNGVVENCYYIAKLSFDCLYFYATPKVDVNLPWYYKGISV